MYHPVFFCAFCLSVFFCGESSGIYAHSQSIFARSDVLNPSPAFLAREGGI
jgi:hypothetical protein